MYPDLQEVHINALRATAQTPMSYSNIGAQQLDSEAKPRARYSLHVVATPSVVTTSAGAGIGYTGFRVRGSDPTRINITIDSIPLNDADLKGVWWWSICCGLHPHR